MRRITGMASLALAAVAVLTGCSSNSKSSAPTDAGPAATKVSQPSPEHASSPAVRLTWSHTTEDDAGDTEIWYVARVKNPGSSAASVALDARALDKTGTIVGSEQETLPNIPAGATFDYFGQLGGGFTELTGTPAKIQVSQVKDAFGMAGDVEQPMLKSSELKLTNGSHDDLFTNAPYSFNLGVKVTNSTHDDLTSGVTQQVVLYDAQGHVVGGDTGSSDNVPDNFPAGMSYREQWTGIPALGKATRAVYTVWAG